MALDEYTDRAARALKALMLTKAYALDLIEVNPSNAPPLFKMSPSYHIPQIERSDSPWGGHLGEVVITSSSFWVDSDYRAKHTKCEGKQSKA